MNIIPAQSKEVGCFGSLCSLIVDKQAVSVRFGNTEQRGYGLPLPYLKRQLGVPDLDRLAPGDCRVKA